MPKPFLGSAKDLAIFLDKNFYIEVKEKGHPPFKALNKAEAYSVLKYVARDVINEEVERLKREDPKAIARYNPGPERIRLLDPLKPSTIGYIHIVLKRRYGNGNYHIRPRKAFKK